MIYTGIGSRETPEHVLAIMATIGQYLAEKGWTLRSGGANGADSAFEEGCDSVGGLKEIYIPWQGFNSRAGIVVTTSEAELLASKYHPAWSKCSQGAKKLHTRNIPQVLGEDLQTPTDMVVCWTVGGKRGGGTGQALRVAQDYKIPIFDLALPETLNQLRGFVTQFRETGTFSDD